MIRTLIIDHYDSFTYLLAQYFGELHGNPIVVQHDKISFSEIKMLTPTHIVLSPGPGTVDNSHDFKIGFRILESCFQKLPILGVCLGHQGIYSFFGGRIVRAPDVMHGKRSFIEHDGGGILKGLPNPFEAMRYHSLMADGRHIPDELRVTAKTKDGLIMSIQYKMHPVFGVQFHPESIGTKFGKRIIKNFLEI